VLIEGNWLECYTATGVASETVLDASNVLGVDIDFPYAIQAESAPGSGVWDWVDVAIIGGVFALVKLFGTKIWDMMLRQINERITKMDERITSLEKQLEESKSKECRFADCPNGRPCDELVRRLTIESADFPPSRKETRFIDPETTGDGSMVIRKGKK